MRRSPRPRAALVVLLFAVLPADVTGQTTARPLDHDDFERWHAIREEAISPDGSWVAYVLSNRDDRVLHVRAPDGPTLRLPRGRAPHFTDDSRYLIATVDAGRGSRGPDTLTIVDLHRLRADPGDRRAVERVAGVGSAQVAEEGPPRIAYRSGRSRGTLVVRTLGTREERRAKDVSEYRLTEDGSTVWFLRESSRGDEAGAYRMDISTGATTPLMVEEGMYARLTVSPDGRRAAFLSARPGEQAPEWRLHAVVDGRTTTLVGEGAPELTPGWQVRSEAEPRFSASGARLFFGAAPREEHADRETADVTVDVWSWTDPYLQPMQLVRARAEGGRSYRVVAHLEGAERRIVQLESPGGPELREPGSGDEPRLLALTDEPYRPLLSWDGRYVDAYLVDPWTGAAERVAEKIRGEAELSPTGRWVTWWDGERRSWWALDAHTGHAAPLNGIPFPVHDEQHDRPGPPDPYGLAGWTAGDEHALVYDRFDLWRVDPSGAESPVAVTDGAGRSAGVRLRLASRPRSAAVSGAQLLAAIHLETRAGGFWTDRVEGAIPPRRLHMSGHRFGAPLAAEAADRILFTRESFSEYPDLWVADGDLSEMIRVSDANPQQTEFAWGTEELVSWASADGVPLRGILYKPQDFDPTRRYPLLVQLYERATDAFHAYHDPAPGSSSINRSFYVSRGYLVFAPDIVYRVGEPGRSVEDAVLPGVRALVEAGFVDPTRIGVQGHSWGGWEAAHLVTRSNLFRAAIAGAPVANMTSAYGGVRWGSGMSRMFQYESEQSRIGATLWAARERYIENSPLFAADRIATPLLLLHNDEDTAVPFEQGIELFSALRRLGKPAWLVNYNGEMHGIRRAENRRDWAIRMQQFFDHYLLDAPPPVWMAEGIPATRKGRTLGLDLQEEPPMPSTVPSTQDGR